MLFGAYILIGKKMITDNQFPSKVIYERFDSTFGINHAIQKLGDKHKISQLGVAVRYNLVGYLGKKHDDVLHKGILYAITITIEDAEAFKKNGIVDKRRTFLQEAAKTFRIVGESRNGKKLILDEDAPYKGMFELAYNRKGKESSF
jgi:hypothetical protein